MDVQLTETQRLLAESARNWLNSRWPEDAARNAFERPGLPSELWDELTGLGWLGIGISEERGGSGRVLGDAVTLQEQLGRSLFPTLVGSTLVVGRLLDGLADGNIEVSRLLVELVDGRLPATVAVQEAQRGFLAPPTVTRLTQTGDGWLLSGEKWFVRDAAESKCLAVFAEIEGGGPAWALVDRAASGISLIRHESSAHDSQSRVVFERVALPDHLVLRPGPLACQAPLAEAMVLEAARLSGIGAWVQARTIAHASTRVQFGRPIGSFQAIQHKVADMTTDVETSLLSTYFAAFCLDAGQDGMLHALAAKLWASEAIQRVVREGHQVHGGVGYITEHSLHLYFRHAATGALLFGAPNELIPLIANQLLDAEDAELEKEKVHE